MCLEIADARWFWPFTLSRGVSGGRGNQSAGPCLGAVGGESLVETQPREGVDGAANGMARTNSEIHNPLFPVVLEPEPIQSCVARVVFWKKERTCRRAGP
jgi:hypothetical protein